MRRLMLLMLPIALVACGSDNSTSGPTLASLAGTWNLQTANGAPLPFTVSSSGGITTQLLSAVVTVGSDGSFTEVGQFRTTINGQATLMTLPSSGTISLSGTLVTLTITGSGTGTGTLNSSTMFTLNDPVSGGILVFVKQ